MFARIFAGSILLWLSVPAAAELRDYCPDRPGLGTPACTVDRGHASIEVGLADWTLQRDDAQRSDRLIFGDVLLRYGVDDRTEVQLGWTSFGHEVDRDRLTGLRARRSGIGDASIALRRNLHNPDGSGFSAALMPFASLPTGRQPIGAGDWAAGLRVPISYELDDRFSLSLTPEVDAAADEDGDGRHLAYGAVAGIAAKLSENIAATVEYEATRDRDPGGHATEQLAGVSLGWLPRGDMQLDIGANAGLRHAADVELYFGVSRRF